MTHNDYKTIAIPAELYGAENWALTSCNKIRLEAVKIYILHSVQSYLEERNSLIL